MRWCFVYLLLVLHLTILGSCTKTHLDVSDYVKWVEDPTKGLRTEKVIGELKYTLQYKPLDYVIAMEEKELRLKRKIIETRAEELKGMQYFTLRIGTKKELGDLLAFELKSEQEYYERSNYFSFDIQNDIVLVEGADTMNCKLFHFVRNYGLAPFVDFVLAFDNRDTAKISLDKELIFDDRVFGNGLIKFSVKSDDINEVPSLIIY